MVVTVSVIDADAAATLVERIKRQVDARSVTFDRSRQQVRVELEKNRDAALCEALNVLESWLAANAHPPVSVEIDDRRYVLGPAA